MPPCTAVTQRPLTVSIKKAQIYSEQQKEVVILSVEYNLKPQYSPYMLIIRMQLRTINGICSPVACNAEK